MGRLVYKLHIFMICQDHKGFIVINTRKPFDRGHTHVHTYQEARYLVNLAHCKKLPKPSNKRAIDSLIRISSDTGYSKLLYKMRGNNYDKEKKSICN